VHITTAAKYILIHCGSLINDHLQYNGADTVFTRMYRYRLLVFHTCTQYRYTQQGYAWM